jgi:hypothetical protein
MSTVQPLPLAPQKIARDARWLAQALDQASGTVRLVEIDRDAYRAASFLDDRLLQGSVKVEYAPWQTVAEAAALAERRDARWIFHIGHVGSTLIARLLGELPQVLSIREPRFLRDLASVPAQHRRPFAAAAPALFSRSFAADEHVVVKATSFVSEIAPELVPSGERALFMFAAPRAYIASILAGPNSLAELRLLAGDRARRMSGRVHGLEDQARSPAHLAAAAWCCEMTAMEAAAEAMSDRHTAWADFDRSLDAMAEELARLGQFFGFPAEPERLRAIADGPLMRRYSKAPEFEYTPDLRRELLQQAARDAGPDIDSALAMVERAADKSPLLARALNRSTVDR